MDLKYKQYINGHGSVYHLELLKDPVLFVKELKKLISNVSYSMFFTGNGKIPVRSLKLQYKHKRTYIHIRQRRHLTHILTARIGLSNFTRF